MKTKKERKPKCLTCNSEAITRGLCANCRGAAAKAIGRGETTERELIKKGLMLPKTKRGRPAGNSAFVKAMRKAI